MKNKLTSGRFWWTIGMIIVFVFTSCSGMLPIEAIEKILMLGIVFYFTMDRNGSNGK